jgi:hypothetical protein
MKRRLATTTLRSSGMFFQWWRDGVYRMNKEAYPLLIALVGAFSIVALFVCYMKGWLSDSIQFFIDLNILYYIIVFPLGIGFFACILKYRHS